MLTHLHTRRELQLGEVTDGDGRALPDQGFITLADSEWDIHVDVPDGHELARRIVASFNACAGIPTGALEAILGGTDANRLLMLRDKADFHAMYGTPAGGR